MSTEFYEKGICLILLQVPNDLIVIVFDMMQLPCSDGDETRGRLQSVAHKCTHIPPLEGSFRRLCWSSFRRCILQTVPGSSASLRGHVHTSILEDVFLKAPSQLTSTHSFRRTDWARKRTFPNIFMTLEYCSRSFFMVEYSKCPQICRQCGLVSNLISKWV